MVQVRDLVGDGSVTKRRVVDGSGEFPADCPLDDNAVRVHVRAVALGEGEEAGAPGAPACWDTRGGGDAAPASASSSSSSPARSSSSSARAPSRTRWTWRCG